MESSILDAENFNIFDVQKAVTLTSINWLNISLNFVPGEKMRARISLAIGVVATVVLVGEHAPGLLAAALAGAILTRLSGPRYCHWLCFTLLFTYMTVFRIILSVRGHSISIFANLVIMGCVQKMSGLAFEIHFSHYPRQKSKCEGAELQKKQLNLSVMDIMEFSLSSIGLVIGPYVTYQVFKDFMTTPFSRAVDRKILIKEKIMKFLPIVVILSGTFNYIFVQEDIYKEDFMDRGLLYLNVYGVMQSIKFRLWMYTGFITQVFTSGLVGYGAYPVEGDNKSCSGPSKDISHLKTLSLEEAKKLKYDFKTLEAVDIYKIETLPLFSEALRYWHIPIQYWLGILIYPSLSKDWFSKSQRILIIFLVSGLWHDVYIGMILGMLLHGLQALFERMLLVVQKEYTGWKRFTFEVVKLTTRHYICNFWILILLIPDLRILFTFFKAIYFIPIIIEIIVFVVVYKMYGKIMQNNNTDVDKKYKNKDN